MVWRAEIEAAPTENENQNNQEYDQSHRSAPIEARAQYLKKVPPTGTSTEIIVIVGGRSIEKACSRVDRCLDHLSIFFVHETAPRA
jgi:hypothetical protein